MSLEQLEKDVAELRKVVADLQAQVSQLQPRGESRRGVLAIVGSMTAVPQFDDVIAYGRYSRLSGKDPPPDWKPGDPIPDADEDWCPR
jgi:hypothetical protein